MRITYVGANNNWNSLSCGSEKPGDVSAEVPALAPTETKVSVIANGNKPITVKAQRRNTKERRNAGPARLLPYPKQMRRWWPNYIHNSKSKQEQFYGEIVGRILIKIPVMFLCWGVVGEE